MIMVNDSVYLTPFSIESDSLLLQQDIISLDEENDTDMGK